MSGGARQPSTPSAPTGSRSWQSRARAWVSGWWPWLVPVVVVLLLRGTHQVANPPQLTPDQLHTLASIARQQLLGETSAPLAAPDVETTHPVFVSVYGRDPASRVHPVVGHWRPRSEEPRLPLAEAVQRAAQAAAAALPDAKGAPSELTIKIDIAGPSRRLWARLPRISNYLFNPGRDGWHGWRGDQHAYRLPSWEVERGEDPDAALEALRTELGGPPAVGRFRTTSFVLLPGDATARPLYRGNVLVDSVTEERVTTALRTAGQYLARHVQADGTYCYEYLPLENRCSAEYNLLRHAGTTYSLFQIHRRLPDPTFVEAAERATEWLRQQTRPVTDAPDRVFLLEGRKAKLGAVGLALIALIEREHAIGDGRDRPLMTQLANFIVSQQREDGYFASFFDWGPEAEVPASNSIYYPGEALLGLVRLHQLAPNPHFLEAAQLGAEFLVRRRWRWGGVEVQVPPDAWLTQAVAELDAIAPQPWLRDYAYEIVRGTDQTMLRAADGTEPDFVGAPSAGVLLPRVTPAGSRSEGLTAAWRMARNRDQQRLSAWLADASLRAARFQLNQQYRPENSYFLPDPLRARGGFRETPTDLMVRIDTVQHNATGLLGVLEILESER